MADVKISDLGAVTSIVGTTLLEVEEIAGDSKKASVDQVKTYIESNTGVLNFGNWTITETSGVLYFATGGTNKMKLDASGNLTVVGDITAFGTI